MRIILIKMLGKEAAYKEIGKIEYWIFKKENS
ncbi:hypothetical protein CDSM653_00535 [Caldanaerobacter subterraneus subsp. pacificus DSM 12653]|uniref:Uncharacterized protein n=1 Tax=Caldanaerobacter subterraneus subsp. pacificus DSM 12653 TaxID=391606 RepID=A0A0F5PP47_9THEO|nr:hypothetical protein CDSM653_00535 [Caldanaerobacter subterraneus subsp. pacificus DSM 12653]